MAPASIHSVDGGGNLPEALATVHTQTTQLRRCLVRSPLLLVRVGNLASPSRFSRAASTVDGYMGSRGTYGRCDVLRPNRFHGD